MVDVRVPILAGTKSAAHVLEKVKPGYKAEFNGFVGVVLQILWTDDLSREESVWPRAPGAVVTSTFSDQDGERLIEQGEGWPAP